jgi:hypothetical protein
MPGGGAWCSKLGSDDLDTSSLSQKVLTSWITVDPTRPSGTASNTEIELPRVSLSFARFVVEAA